MHHLLATESSQDAPVTQEIQGFRGSLPGPGVGATASLGLCGSLLWLFAPLDLQRGPALAPALAGWLSG